MLEKRNYRRYDVWFPVTLTQDGIEVWAICRDASSGGVLLSAVRAVPIGAKVTARFKVSREAKAERSVAATVVRSDLNEDALVLAFPHRIALEFDGPVPELLEEIAEIATETGPSSTR